MGYDRYQFIENIESIQGILYIRTDSYEDVKANIYEGLSRNIVVIDVTDLDEDVSEGEGTGLLTKLGVAHLIPIFYPKEEEVRIDALKEEMSEEFEDPE